MQIINNKYLSYGPWIFWRDIIRDNNAPIDIQYNGERGQRWDNPVSPFPKSSLDCLSLLGANCLSVISSCFSLPGPCHKSCGDYCWGPNKDQCQICEYSIVLFPFFSVIFSAFHHPPPPPPSVSSQNVSLHRQKYTETERHKHKDTHTYTHTHSSPVMRPLPSCHTTHA